MHSAFNTINYDFWVPFSKKAFSKCCCFSRKNLWLANSLSRYHKREFALLSRIINFETVKLSYLIEPSKLSFNNSIIELFIYLLLDSFVVPRFHECPIVKVVTRKFVTKKKLLLENKSMLDETMNNFFFLACGVVHMII